MRIPKSQTALITRLLATPRRLLVSSEMHVTGIGILALLPIRHTFPVLDTRVPAGFPSPADDYIEGRLNLNKHLIHHKAATLILRVSGISMIQAGIFDRDELIVDRSLEPAHKQVVIAVVNGELTVKRLYMRDGTKHY